MADLDRRRILILDDQEDQANAIRSLLLDISDEQWRAGGAPPGFALTSDDVDVALRCAPLIADWRRGAPTPHAVVLADVNMYEGRPDEGALPVYEALQYLESPPALVAMSQFRDHRDTAREKIERLRRSPKNRVPTIVAPKYSELEGVKSPKDQLSMRDWRRIIVLAITGRPDFELFRRLDSMAAFWGEARGLTTFTEPLQRFKEHLGKPLVILVTEPGSFERIFVERHTNNTYDRSLTGYPADIIVNDLFVGDGPKSLRQVRETEALLLLDSDAFVADLVKQEVSTSIALLQDLRIDRRIGPDGVDFPGQLYLCISPHSHELFDVSPFYRALPKVHLPSMADFKVNREVGALVDYLLNDIFHMVLDPLDHAAVCAADWSLREAKGFQGLHDILKWIKTEHGRRPRAGVVAEMLSRDPGVRNSIYAGLEAEPLLLYILDRVAQEIPDRPLHLQFAAFLFYKYAINSPVIDTERELTRLWKLKGAFDALTSSGDIAGIVKAARGGWPPLEDKVLYKAKTGPTNTGNRIKQMFDDLLGYKLRKYKGSDQIRARIAQHLSSGTEGRKSKVEEASMPWDIMARPYRPA